MIKVPLFSLEHFYTDEPTKHACAHLSLFLPQNQTKNSRFLASGLSTLCQLSTSNSPTPHPAVSGTHTSILLLLSCYQTP
jgi:hypothetical protein